MELLKVLKSAFDRLRSDILKNEAQVKQSIIVPVLRALDWDDSDPTELVPEFKVSNGGSVDYALLRSSDRKPLVFIEAKRLGNADEKGEKQLFDYATNRGVPLLILTDGGVWDFYLSMAERRSRRAAFLSCGFVARRKHSGLCPLFRRLPSERSCRFRASPAKGAGTTPKQQRKKQSAQRHFGRLARYACGTG